MDRLGVGTLEAGQLVHSDSRNLGKRSWMDERSVVQTGKRVRIWYLKI